MENLKQKERVMSIRRIDEGQEVVFDEVAGEKGPKAANISVAQ